MLIALFLLYVHVDKIYDYVTDVDESIQLQKQEYVAVHVMQLLHPCSYLFSIVIFLQLVL